MPTRPAPTCPSVAPGRGSDHLARAKWTIEYGDGDPASIEHDLAEASRLDPTAWEPWAVRARLAYDDADDCRHCLRHYERAVALDAPQSIVAMYCALLAETRRHAEAEAAYGRLLERWPADGQARFERAKQRAWLGDIEGALADMSDPQVLLARHVVLESRGILRWIAGDHEAAFDDFNSSFSTQTSESSTSSRLWAHLCNVARGHRGGLVDDPPIALPTPRRDVRAVATPLAPGSRDSGDRPTAWIQELLVLMFLDRLHPDQVLAAAAQDLEATDAWRPPADDEPVAFQRFTPPQRIFRSQVQFWCGMWYASKRQGPQARHSLAEAANDRFDGFERLAARAQLDRLEPLLADDRTVPPLVPARRTAVVDPVSRFAALQIATPEFIPTVDGPQLRFDDPPLGDTGLRPLLESRNLRFVTRLDLRRNRLTAAGMAAFRESSHIVNLRVLELAGNPIGDIGLDTLLRSSALLSLRTLDVSDCGLTDRGFQLLAVQRWVKLERVVLGQHVEVDMPIWARLVDRYGAGLVGARGVFRTPYEPPFDPARQVRVIHDAPPRQADWEQAVALVFTFRLADVMRWHWLACAGEPSGERQVQALARVRQVEARLSAQAGPMTDVRDWWGFSLIAAGIEPLAAYCGGCGDDFDPKDIRVDAQPSSSARRCPHGHLLAGSVWLHPRRPNR